MESLVGKEIWLVNYRSVEFQDCNGVYSTKEKAEAAILADVERCYDWKAFECVVEEEDFSCYEFLYCGPHAETEELQGVTIEKMIIE